MNNELAVVEPESGPRLVARVEDVRQAMAAVRTMHRDILRKDIDYGVIPGTGNKPCLFKPGAETLLMAFQLGVGLPEIEHVPLDAPAPGHIEYRVKLPIIYRATGAIIGYGVASCSTMEKKYRYRSAERTCPSCGKATIIKGKEEYGGGWLCFAKRGGCGAKYADNAPEIISQQLGQVENPDPADQYNTCLKMAKKRALVDGALTCCAASGTFTQDVEEWADEAYTDPPRLAARPAPDDEDVRANQAQQTPRRFCVIKPFQYPVKGRLDILCNELLDDGTAGEPVYVEMPLRTTVKAGDVVECLVKPIPPKTLPDKDGNKHKITAFTGAWAHDEVHVDTADDLSVPDHGGE